MTRHVGYRRPAHGRDPRRSPTITASSGRPVAAARATAYLIGGRVPVTTRTSARRDMPTVSASRWYATRSSRHHRPSAVATPRRGRSRPLTAAPRPWETAERRSRPRVPSPPAPLGCDDRPSREQLRRQRRADTYADRRQLARIERADRARGAVMHASCTYDAHTMHAPHGCLFLDLGRLAPALVHDHTSDSARSP